MIELQIATIISFVVSIFILYRLLVSKYSQHVKLLQDEIAIKQNYKAKLDELKLFYEEECLMLRSKLEKAHGSNEVLENQIKEVQIALDEIELELHRENIEKSKYELIAKRKEKYNFSKLEKAKLELEAKLTELELLRGQYSELVLFIKQKHGIESLLEFHDFNPMEETKIRKKHNREQRFKSKAT